VTDRAEIEGRVRDLSHLMTMHAGGVELEDVDADGNVRVRFTGMCTGCLYRPVTMAATIRPALMELDGVASVQAAGSRVSEKAERRLAEDLGGGWWNLPARVRSATAD
jgi:Fe-S cluster biogenesis protein NfuA